MHTRESVRPGDKDGQNPGGITLPQLSQNAALAVRKGLWGQKLMLALRWITGYLQTFRVRHLRQVASALPQKGGGLPAPVQSARSCAVRRTRQVRDNPRSRNPVPSCCRARWKTAMFEEAKHLKPRRTTPEANPASGEHHRSQDNEACHDKAAFHKRRIPVPRSEGTRTPGCCRVPRLHLGVGHQGDRYIGLAQIPRHYLNLKSSTAPVRVFRT